MRTITDDERRARIATRHALAPQNRLASVEQTVAAMTALHATEPANVYLSAFARAEVTRDDVDRALYVARSVVRQLAMRRTVFAFPVDLLPAVRGSASARVAGQLTARLAKEVGERGLTDSAAGEDGPAWVASTCAAVLAELAAAPATTAELRARLPALELRLEPAGGTSGQGTFPVAPRVLSTLAADGSVLRGANAAGWKVSRPYWTRTEQWLPDLPGPLPVAEGYAELVRRWLWTFGPGTEADLVWWCGATKGAVRSALADVGAVAVALEDGSPAWLHPDDGPDEAPEVTSAAREPWAALLPALDPTTMGWKERGFYLGEHVRSLFDVNGNGGPTAWWCGRIVGGWRQRDDGTVLVLPLDTMPPQAREPLEEQARRLTAWLDGDVVRSIYQSPLARAHAHQEAAGS